MKKHVVPALVISLIVLAFAPLAAQERGSVSGTVKDDEGNALENAVLTISGPLLPQGREYVTNKEGTFIFQALPPGSYTLSVTHPNMLDYRGKLAVQIDRQTQVSVKMTPIGKASEEVTVIAVSPIVDVKSTEVSLSWQSTVVEQLPLGRSYSALFQLAPGVADNRDFAPNAGGNKQDNVYLYDGSNITNPLFGYLGANFSELDIQEVNIKRGAISAEFGRAAGMVTNAITKSGTNRVMGSFRFVFEPSGLTAPSRDANLVTRYNRFNPAIGLGGPLIRDKAWWYVSANLPRSTTTGRINALGAVPDAEDRSNELFVKLTSNPHRAHLLSASFRTNSYRSDNSGIGVNDHPGVAVDGKGLDRIFYGSWVWTISQSSFFELKYDHVDEKYKSVPITDLGYLPTFDVANLGRMGYFRTAPGYIVGGASLSGQYVGAASETNTQNFFRDEIKAVFSKYLDFRGHSHLIKAGFGYDDGGEHLDRKANGWGSIILTTYSGAPAFRARYYSQQAPQDSRGRTYSFFIQDAATIGERLTLTLGLLANRDEFSVKTGGERNTFLKFDFGKEIQPRVGATVVLDKRVGDKLYANYGRYNNMDNRSIARAAAPIRIFRNDAYFDLQGVLLADSPQAAETGKVILPGIKPTYTDEFVLGYSRPFSQVWSIEFWAQHRNIKHVIEDFPTRGRDTSPGTYVYGNLDGQTMSFGGNPEFHGGQGQARLPGRQFPDSAPVCRQLVLHRHVHLEPSLRQLGSRLRDRDFPVLFIVLHRRRPGALCRRSQPERGGLRRQDPHPQAPRNLAVSAAGDARRILQGPERTAVGRPRSGCLRQLLPVPGARRTAPAGHVGQPGFPGLLHRPAGPVQRGHRAEGHEPVQHPDGADGRPASRPAVVPEPDVLRVPQEIRADVLRQLLERQGPIFLLRLPRARTAFRNSRPEGSARRGLYTRRRVLGSS